MLSFIVQGPARNMSHACVRIPASRPFILPVIKVILKTISRIHIQSLILDYYSWSRDFSLWTKPPKAFQAENCTIHSLENASSHSGFLAVQGKAQLQRQHHIFVSQLSTRLPVNLLNAGSPAASEQCDSLTNQPRILHAILSNFFKVASPTAQT